MIFFLITIIKTPLITLLAPINDHCLGVISVFSHFPFNVNLKTCLTALVQNDVVQEAEATVIKDQYILNNLNF